MGILNAPSVRTDQLDRASVKGSPLTKSHSQGESYIVTSHNLFYLLGLGEMSCESNFRLTDRVISHLSAELSAAMFCYEDESSLVSCAINTLRNRFVKIFSIPNALNKGNRFTNNDAEYGTG